MRQGHKVYVFAPAPNEDDPLADDPLVLRFPSLPIFDLDYSLALPLSGAASRTLRDVQFDVVHTHHPLWVGVWGAWYARRMGLPLVTTIHTQYELFANLVPLPQPLVKAYLRRKVRRYCNMCHVVTTPSPSTARRLRKLGVKSPVEVVPNPIELAAFGNANGEAIRRKHGLKGKFVLGYLGRLSREKQIHVLVDALELVRRQIPDAHLLIVGDGPARPELEKLVAARKLADAVTLVGPVPHAEVPHYQAAFDVFLSASLGETQPLASTEAMAAGTPVVAVAAMGVSDLIEDGVSGFLVSRAAAAEQMAAAVVKLARDRELRRRVSEAGKQVAAQFRPDNVARKLLETYQQAIKLAGAGRRD